MFIPFSAQSARSPRVRELSERLQTAIHDYQRQVPMTPTEVRQALRDAASAAAGSRSAGMPVGARTLFWMVVIALPIVMSAIIRALR